MLQEEHNIHGSVCATATVRPPAAAQVQKKFFGYVTNGVFLRVVVVAAAAVVIAAAAVVADGAAGAAAAEWVIQHVKERLEEVGRPQLFLEVCIVDGRAKVCRRRRSRGWSSGDGTGSNTSNSISLASGHGATADSGWP
jgi:hypothetical protein